MAEVYINQKFEGNVEDGKIFVEKFLEKRRSSKISGEANICYFSDRDEVHIDCSKGRARRPLIVVKEGKSSLTETMMKQLEKGELSWSDLISQNYIEYLDSLEEESAYVALSKVDLTEDHTHLEINPISMLGLVGSLVPNANFSPGARVEMGAKNQKQALGFYAANYLVRMDTDVNILHSPQKPLVQTAMHEIYNDDKHPFGQNLVVAVMSYSGYNMDDAIILNNSSIQRGLGRSTYFWPAVAEELRYSGGLTDKITVPDEEVKGFKGEHDYRMLETDGIISPEAVVAEGDVIIGKTSPPRFLSGVDEYNLTSNIRRESSVGMMHGQKGTVDFVLLTENSEGNKLIQVRIRETMVPEIGDKFTSRYGQKGVIGMVKDQTDMPFSASGIVPDLIFSPHGIPSRMTISHLMELIGGKVAALSGRIVDGTAFDGESSESLRKELHSFGFRENGTETMYNGETGEQMTARIFIGNMFYLKLRHMVALKMHSRARGPVQLLTRQPTEGRAKEGGLRLGEMEKDTFVAHGASLLLKERFDSDRTVVPICEGCGLIAIYNEYKNKSYCPICGDNVDISNIEVSYAFKLMLDEFRSMGILPKLKLRNKY